MRVDFPRPDSPADKIGPTGQVRRQPGSLEDPPPVPSPKTPKTCHHECEVKPLLDGFAV